MATENGRLGLVFLPSELISMVFELCEYQEDVSHLRLACKRFAAVGAKHLVEWLHITFREKSFQNLRSISKHPVLRKFVLHITYEADLLKMADYDTWLRAIPVPAGFKSHRQFNPTVFYKKTELAKAYDAFKKEVAAVNDVLKENRDFRVLASSFKCFPNLEEIDLILGGCPEVLLYDGKKSQTLSNAFDHTLSIPYILHLKKTFDVPREVRQLDSVLRAVTSSGVGLKNLNCGTIDWSFFEAHGDIGACGRSYNIFATAPDRYLSAFRNLKSICLAIQLRESMFYSSGAVTPIGGFPRAARLGQALSAAQGLKSLSLTLVDPGFSYSNPFQMGIITWDSIALQTNWPQLEHFDLRFTPFSAEFFLNFLERHSKTLQSVTLDNVYVTPSAVPEFFDGLKNTINKFSKLEEVELGGYLMWSKMEMGHQFLHWIDMHKEANDGSCTIGMKVSQYLLKGGENPFKESYLTLEKTGLP